MKVATRNIAQYRDPAVIVIDQLKHAYIAGELDPVETANWFPKVARKDYQIGLNLTGSSVDDPDQQFYENYYCGSQRNYSGYCNKEIDALTDQQSAERDQNKRRQIVYEIDSKLQQDAARPIILHNAAATCWYSYVKNVTLMTNSIYNGWRMEDWWLDKSQGQTGRRALIEPFEGGGIKGFLRRPNTVPPRPAPCRRMAPGEIAGRGCRSRRSGARSPRLPWQASGGRTGPVKQRQL